MSAVCLDAVDRENFYHTPAEVVCCFSLASQLVFLFSECLYAIYLLSQTADLVSNELVNCFLCKNFSG